MEKISFSLRPWGPLALKSLIIAVVLCPDLGWCEEMGNGDPKRTRVRGVYPEEGGVRGGSSRPNHAREEE